MNSEIKCEFLVYGFDQDPSGVTDAIGLQPTELIRKGDVRHRDPTGERPDILHDDNVWCLKSDLYLGSSTEEHIDFMLNRLSDYKEKIKRLSDRCNVELSVYGYVYASQVGSHLDAKVIAELASYGMGLDIDIYSLFEEDE